MMPCSSSSYSRSFSNLGHDPHIVLLKTVVSRDCWMCSAVTRWSIYVCAHCIRKRSHTFSRSKARWIIPHDLSAKGEISQNKKVWFTQEHAGSCWQLRDWSSCVSTPLTGSSLTPQLPHALPALAVQSQPPASPLAIPGTRQFKMLQRLTLADETMCSRLGSWRRESQCLEDGRWKWTSLDHRACLGVAQLQHRCGWEMSFCRCQQIPQVWGLSGMSKMEMCSRERI